MKALKKVVLAAALVLIPALMGFAASDESNFIHNWVLNNHLCKNGAISDEWGYIVTYGSNGAVWSGIPSSLADALRAEQNAGRGIYDICITENGNWYLVGDKLLGKGYPTEMGNKISEAARQGDAVLAVSFNDSGKWIVVTNNHLYCSSSDLMQFVNSYKGQYGYVESACISDSGAVLVIYQNGWAGQGGLPSAVTNYLNNRCGFNVVYGKFTDSGSYLFTDNSGYSYGYDLK